jgi:hypothetical protein
MLYRDLDVNLSGLNIILEKFMVFFCKILGIRDKQNKTVGLLCKKTRAWVFSRF